MSKAPQTQPTMMKVIVLEDGAVEVDIEAVLMFDMIGVVAILMFVAFVCMAVASPFSSRRSCCRLGATLPYT